MEMQYEREKYPVIINSLSKRHCVTASAATTSSSLYAAAAAGTRDKRKSWVWPCVHWHRLHLFCPSLRLPTLVVLVRLPACRRDKHKQ